MILHLVQKLINFIKLKYSEKSPTFLTLLYTLPTAEILSAKNVQAFLFLVLNEIIQKKYPENMKKIVGAIWKLPAK